MLSTSQLLQQAVLGEKWVKSRLDQTLTTFVLYAKRTYIVHFGLLAKSISTGTQYASPAVLSMFSSGAQYVL
jgi:hypothetical protein